MNSSARLFPGRAAAGFRGLSWLSAVASAAVVMTACGASQDDGSTSTGRGSSPSASAAESGGEYVNPTAGRRLAVQRPGMHEAQVETRVYKTVDGRDLAVDVYRPAGVAAATPLPVVVLVHGDTPDASPKDFGGFVGWGQLLASHGLATAAVNHRPDRGFSAAEDAYSDLHDFLSWLEGSAADLRLDASRVAMLGFSAGAPFALRAAYDDPPVEVQGAVVYYGPVDQRAYGRDDQHAFYSAAALMQPGSAPLLVVTAGQDSHAQIGASAKLLEEAASGGRLPVTLTSQPSGRHGFDYGPVEQATTDVMNRTVEFLTERLR